MFSLLVVVFVVIPGMIIWAVAKWRGAWRAAAVLPVPVFVIAVMLADTVDRGRDATARGVYTMIAVLGVAVVYYAVLFIAHWRRGRA